MHCVALQLLQLLGIFHWSGNYPCMNWKTLCCTVQLSVKVLEEKIHRNLICIGNIFYSTAIHKQVISFSCQYMPIRSLDGIVYINRLQIKYELGLFRWHFFHALHAQHRSGVRTFNHLQMSSHAHTGTSRCANSCVQTHRNMVWVIQCVSASSRSFTNPAFSAREGQVPALPARPARSQCLTVRSCGGSARYRPLSVTHNTVTRTHIIFPSEDWIHSTSKPEG